MDTHTLQSTNFEKNPLLARLLELHDIPETLFIKGELPSFTVDTLGRLTPRVLTIVGGRAHSRYAKEVIDSLVASLKGQPVIVVSGLALGVDSLAHRAALTNGMLTISIPGSGLADKALYPREHVTLAGEILASGGCLMSEHSDETKAMKWTFLSRNRLMAALSDAVLIVEAKEKSGTLVTARQALELGKTIGVVPGDIFSPFLKGSHDLLRDGATPVMSKRDLLSLLSLPSTDEEEAETTKSLPLLSGDEKMLYSLLDSPLSKSDLLELSKLSPSVFLMALTNLEMEGYISVSLHEVCKVV